MPRPIDFSGRTVARWTVLHRTPKRPGAHWWCRCECGHEREISGGVLSATAKAFERDGLGGTGSGISMMCRGCALRDKQRAGGYQKGVLRSVQHRERLSAANRGRRLTGESLDNVRAGLKVTLRAKMVRKCRAIVERYGITAAELFPEESECPTTSSPKPNTANSPS